MSNSENMNKKAIDTLRSEKTSLLFLVSLGLISFTVLALQLALVRIFSVMVWYHFTFMIISLALLGYGASGSFLSAFKDKFFKSGEKAFFLYASLFASITLLVAYIFICFFPPDPFALFASGDNEKISMIKIIFRWFIFIINYLLLLSPFFIAGLIISGAISSRPKYVAKLYFADLFGAGLGCIGMLYLLSLLGGERSVLFCSLLFSLCALIIYYALPGDAQIKRGKTSPNMITILLCIALSAGCLIVIPGVLNIPIAGNKALNGIIHNPEQKILFTRWNAISRVDVFTTLDRLLLWKVSSAYDGKYPRGKGLMIDADAFTPIAADDGIDDEKQILNYTITSLGYQICQKNKALIIGPGGGMDILTADYNGMKDITGVELNPLVVKIVGDTFRDFNKNLYHRDHIKIVADEGRSFISRSQSKYDIIQIPLVDTWAALASGAYSLSENYLYTVDAIEDFYTHLSDNGILSIIRWDSAPSTGLLRLAANATQALQNLAIENPGAHIIICADANLTNFLLRKKPWSEKEAEEISALCKKYKYRMIFSPYKKGFTIPYVYGLGYDDELIAKNSASVRQSDDKTTGSLASGKLFAGIKRGEFKTAYLNPEFAFSPATVDAKIAALYELCKREGVIPIRFSGLDGYNDFEHFFMSDSKADFFKDYPLKVSPTTDESPFFFQHFKFSIDNPDLNFFKRFSIFGFNTILSQAGILAILSLFTIALFLSIILIIFPLIIGERESLKTKGKWAPFAYFSCLGFAYIFIEISQIQRFILFLGQPVFSISIVLFTFLTSSGIGSMFSGRIKKKITETVLFSIIGIFVIAFAYFVFQKFIFDIFLSSGFGLRVLVSIAMLFPLGFLMGMLFPSGIRLISQKGKDHLIPWLWAANGICSVLGSILSSFLAMEIGFSRLLLLAALIYLIAALFIKKITFADYE